MKKGFVSNGAAEAEELVNTVMRKIDYINSLLLGNVNISFENDGNYKYLYREGELEVLLEDNYPKYLDTMTQNLELLSRFAYDPTDMRFLPESQQTLALILPLIDFVGSGSTDNPEHPLYNVVSLINNVQAKIKLHTQNSVTVSDVALLGQVTPMGVIQAIKRNTLKASKVGNVWFIDSHEAIMWLSERA